MSVLFSSKEDKNSKEDVEAKTHSDGRLSHIV